MAQPTPSFVAAETYYLAPDGRDTWSGTLPAPAADGTDGPWATLPGAVARLRTAYQQGQLGGPVTVCLRGGRYHLTAPIALTAADAMPVTFASAPGESAILDGGRKLTGWTVTTLNGHPAWTLDLPEVAAGAWYFRSLYVNDQRRARPRLPKQGLFRIAEVQGMSGPKGWAWEHYDTFRLEGDAMRAFRNLTDIEVVAYHFWIDERLPIARYDAATGMITTRRASLVPLVEAFGNKLAPCFLDNVAEALTEPGEWYLDRATGRLTYLPLPGEDPATAEVYAPRLLQLLTLTGQPEQERHVQWLRFHGLRFEHTDWVQPNDPEDTAWTAWKDPARTVSRHSRGKLYGAAAQAAADVPGAIALRGVRQVSFQDCRFAHLGWYGLDIGDGCSGIRVVGNEFYDLGAGGVRVNGAAWEEPIPLRTSHCVITDNHLHQLGRAFPCAIGIIVFHAAHNRIAHNHIHDLYYSGISVGWVWGYAPSITSHNRIEYNHIHDLGQGLLSDMGGIYTLGVQPGTVIRGNVIHDVTKLNYGAWCIYPDEGTSHVIIEHNLCYRTNGEVFHQHYGRENLVRNNLFAFGGDSVLALSRGEGHNSLTFEKNIFLSRGKPMLVGGYNCLLANRHLRSDTNLFWDFTGAPPCFKDRNGVIELDAWRALGLDRQAVVADPRCADPEHDDFTLAPDSPAFALGFAPLDIAGAGPRPPGQRT